jgi:hypothetical protein
MSMMNRLQRGGGSKPPIGIVYGRPGVGKTTLAAHAPGVIFIQTEDGLTSPMLAEIPTFGVLETYEDVLNAFEAVAMNHKEQGWQTVVIDSIDRMAPLITDYTCRMNGWKTLEDGAYGKGKVAYVAEWRNFMTMCLSLRNTFNLGLIMLGHHKAVKITPPDTEPFTQYSLTLIDDVSRVLVGDADFVLFATYPTHTISTDQGFGKKVSRAITERPVLFTQESGARVAKNRYSMPEKIPLQFDQLAQYIPSWRALAQAQEALEEVNA